MKKVKRELHCPKCKNSFYTSFNDLLLPCFHCGNTSVRVGRGHLRVEAFKPCEIIKDEVKIPIRIVDISYGGIGIVAFTLLPFTKNDRVTVKIPFYTLRHARLIWIDNFYGVTRAGLVFGN